MSIIKLKEAEYKGIYFQSSTTIGGFWIKIQSIKMIRQRTSAGLREAKEAVDFAIEKFLAVNLTWEDYDSNFHLWASAAEAKGAIPVRIVQSEDEEAEKRFFATCPCGCNNRFEVKIPEEELMIAPIIDDDLEPDPFAHCEELDEEGEPFGPPGYILQESIDKARAERQQEGIAVEKKKEMYKCSGCSSVFAGGNDLLQHFKTCTAGVS